MRPTRLTNAPRGNARIALGQYLTADLPPLADSFRSGQRVVGVLGLGVALWLLIRRRHFAGPDRRQRMGPLIWYGPVALLR